MNNNLKQLIIKHKYAIMSLILAALVIILIFVIFTFNKDSEEPQQTQTTVFNPKSLSEKSDGPLSGDSRFLVVCQEENVKDITFMTLIDFKIYGEKIIVTPIDYNTSTSDGTFREKYEYGGISLLIDAVENERNTAIDRYVILDKDGFCDIIDLMGEIELYVDEEFTYSSSEKSYQIGIGNNTLEAPMLYSYLKIKYLNSDEVQFTELLCKIINSYLNSVNEDDALSYFEDLSNCINSDLSISDFYSAEKDIKHLINGNTICVPYCEGE